MRAQLLAPDQPEHEVADLHVVAGVHQALFHLAVDRREHARLAQRVLPALDLGARRGELLAQGVALRDGLVERVLADEVLLEQRLLVAHHAILVLQQRLQARDLGRVGLGLDLRIDRIDLGEHLALADALADVGGDPRDAPGDFRAEARVDDVLHRADDVLDDLDVRAPGPG